MRPPNNDSIDLLTSAYFWVPSSAYLLFCLFTTLTTSEEDPPPFLRTLLFSGIGLLVTLFGASVIMLRFAAENDKSGVDDGVWSLAKLGMAFVIAILPLGIQIFSSIRFIREKKYFPNLALHPWFPLVVTGLSWFLAMNLLKVK